MRTRGRCLAFSLTALLGLVGACAEEADGGDLSEREQAYADAFAEDMADDDDGFDVTAEEADCMSEAILQELGAEPFEDADVEPADLLDSDDTPGELLGTGVVSADQADAIAERWTGCTDLDAGLAASFGTELDLDEEAVACLADGMRDSDAHQDFVRISFTEGEEEAIEPFVRDVVRLSTECVGIENSPLVTSMAESFAADGALDEAQARCVAVGVVDLMGLDRLLEVTSGTGSFEDAPPDVQHEVTRAVLDATVECGVPLDQLSGG